MKIERGRNLWQYRDRIHQQKIFSAKKYCKETYDYTVDLKLTRKQNTAESILRTPQYIFLQKLKGQRFHNLCETEKLPPRYSGYSSPRTKILH